jgi:hypothetical protein
MFTLTCFSNRSVQYKHLTFCRQETKPAELFRVYSLVHLLLKESFQQEPAFFGRDLSRFQLNIERNALSLLYAYKCHKTLKYAQTQYIEYMKLDEE